MTILQQDLIVDALAKEQLNLIITDSGLGGLSICADIDSKLRQNVGCSDLHITYFNAWPAQNSGYNTFNPLSERIRIFDEALNSMAKLKPDLIVIACNTLSALYEHTKFRHSSEIPVLGIIDFGVDLFYDKLTKHPDSQLLVLGTTTMISENNHENLLVEKGIRKNRIVTQACNGLATTIEQDADGGRVSELTIKYISEAIQKTDPTVNKLFVALCCTHFGFIAPLILKNVKRYYSGQADTLDPNGSMSTYLVNKRILNSSIEPNFEIDMISKVTIHDKQVKSIASFVEQFSPKTAKALADYKHQPDLFNF